MRRKESRGQSPDHTTLSSQSGRPRGTSDVVEDEVVESRVDRAGGGRGFLWTGAAKLLAGLVTGEPVNNP